MITRSTTERAGFSVRAHVQFAFHVRARAAIHDQASALIVARCAIVGCVSRLSGSLNSVGRDAWKIHAVRSSEPSGSSRPAERGFFTWALFHRGA